MDKNLFKRIKEYSASKPVRFHVPSHKGFSLSSIDLYGMDITELDFSDNLNAPSEIIDKEEENAAQIFGSKKTIFTVNGATAAIMASIMSSIKPGEKLLLPMNSHISCYYGAVHCGADLLRMPVDDYVSGVSVAELEKVLSEHSDIKACVITNPTYYGCCSDIGAICDLLKKYHILSIIDESHGTHFHFYQQYPLSAIDAGADIVIHSGHKSINGLTQTGLIHLMNQQINENDLRFNLRMVQSTSPSYVLLLSLINAVNELKDADKLLFDLKLWYNYLNKELTDTKFFRLLNFEKVITRAAFDYDPLKLCIAVNGSDLSGHKIMKLLQSQDRIYGEMAERDCILFAAGLNSKLTDYKCLTQALKKLDQSLTDGPKSEGNQQYILQMPKQVIPIREAAFCEYEYTDIDQCANRISADFISVYPPGAPYIVPGDLIDESILNVILGYPKDKVNGIKNNQIKTIKR